MNKISPLTILKIVHDTSHYAGKSLESIEDHILNNTLFEVVSLKRYGFPGGITMWFNSVYFRFRKEIKPSEYRDFVSLTYKDKIFFVMKMDETAQSVIINDLTNMAESLTFTFFPESEDNWNIIKKLKTTYLKTIIKVCYQKFYEEQK